MCVTSGPQMIAYVENPLHCRLPLVLWYSAHRRRDAEGRGDAAPAAGIPRETMKALGPLLTCVVLQIGALAAIAEGPIITGFEGNGTLRWRDSASNATYRVEWTPSLQDKWRSSWDGLSDLPAGSNGVHAVSVPMFYRVVRIEPRDAPADEKRVLTLDTTTRTDTMFATQKEPTLWATLDGTVYRVSIDVDGPLYMGVGQRRRLTAHVAPPIPGNFEWAVTGAKVSLENATSQTVVIVAGPEPSERVGDQTISVKFRPGGRTP
jgi:hypothetical protein